MYSRFSNSLKIVNSKSQCIQRYGKCLNIWPQLQSIIWWSVDVCCWGNFGNIPVFVACYSVKEMYTAPFPSANVFWTIVGSGDGRLFFILVSTQLERYRSWRGYVTKLWPKIMAVGRWFEITVAKKGIHQIHPNTVNQIRNTHAPKASVSAAMDPSQILALTLAPQNCQCYLLPLRQKFLETLGEQIWKKSFT